MDNKQGGNTAWEVSKYEPEKTPYLDIFHPVKILDFYIRVLSALLSRIKIAVVGYYSLASTVVNFRSNPPEEFLGNVFLKICSKFICALQLY